MVFVPDTVVLPARVTVPDEVCELDAEVDGDLVVVFVAETLRDPEGDVLGLEDVDGVRVRRAVVDDDGVTRIGVSVADPDIAFVRETVDVIDASVTDCVRVADTLSSEVVVDERLGQYETVGHADCEAVKVDEKLSTGLTEEQNDGLELPDTEVDMRGDRLADGLGDMVGDDEVERVGKTDLVSVDAAVKEADTRGDSVDEGSVVPDATSVACEVVRADVEEEADVDGDEENERVPGGDAEDDAELVGSADLLCETVDDVVFVDTLEEVPHADRLGVSVYEGENVRDAVPDTVREPTGESLGSLVFVTVVDVVRVVVDV